MSGVMIVPLSRIISPISRIMVNYPHNVFMFNDLRGGRGGLYDRCEVCPLYLPDDQSEARWKIDQ